MWRTLRANEGAEVKQTLVPRPTRPNRDNVVGERLGNTCGEPLAPLARKDSADIGVDNGDIALVSKGQ
jgi:hypothetical protein